ncbi:hypothetical protein HZA26_02905 [Candidatus Nomurabacteria bacterium]|nr:hypothetical protein [Candidatus Nomurabacteria bacterium]
MMVRNREKNFSKQKGSLMVEILIVVSIITASLLVALNVTQKSIYLSRQSLNQSQVAFLLEEGAEAVRVRRDGAWANISGLTIGTNYYPFFSGGTWTLSTTPNTVGIFTRRIVVSSVYRDANQDIASSGTLDAQTKLVTVTVSWVDAGQNLSKTLQFYISDIFSS